MAGRVRKGLQCGGPGSGLSRGATGQDTPHPHPAPARGRSRCFPMSRARVAFLAFIFPFTWGTPLVRAAEPMMDSSLLGSYRSSAPNLVTDGLFTEALER